MRTKRPTPEQGRFRANHRMSMIMQHVDRLADYERATVSAQARERRREFGIHNTAAPS